ncbi:PREDICTED: uncharacterized protein LOC106119377 [Papilio xuthus]|uniref:Uncharacterized protein LOC106119377 n=1 Tax=Papilio xuthus TaxID=66420 RepID=A0AAJ7EAT7_PAPXU|nr:PREDICTED: uncharacterized protein LOC106119377 [Papilio xuthus]
MKTRLEICVFFAYCILIRVVITDTLEDFRTRRQINSIPLVFPYGGTYKLLIGMAVPIHNEDHVNLAFGINFQYQYIQFQNVSELSRYYFIKTVSREQRDLELKERSDERLVFYKAAADMLQMKGMNGIDCVMRAICEAAQYPVSEEGLVGEIIHILLTPDYGRSPFEVDTEWYDMMSPYIDAAVAGRQMFNCASIYSNCPEGQGVLELISILRDE